MNSLNLLSARVIGKIPLPAQPAVKSSRTRSFSESSKSKSFSDVTVQSTHFTPPRRSASHRHIAQAIADDEKAVSLVKVEDDETKESLEEDIIDEKAPLISEKDSDVSSATPGKNHILLAAARLANALVKSLRWVLSKLAAPGVYVVACFYDTDGNFSPLLPFRKGRRKPQETGSKSTALAVGLSGSSDPNSRATGSTSEKRATRSDRTRSADTLITTTSESDVDRKGRGGSQPRETRSKSQKSVASEEVSPTRRSIRIKLNNEGSSRSKKSKKAQTLAAAAADSNDISPEAITAANLKSPTSPAASLRMTKYPHAPAPPRPLIPRRQPSYTSPPTHRGAIPQKTLVIDLDETLIHSLAKGGRMSSGHMVEVKLSTSLTGLGMGPQHPILYYVHKRPHCDDFLKKVSKWYNLVIFTASVQEYADPVIDWLEQERKYFSARYYRQHCTFRNGAYIKDLSSVEPDLSRVVILDNSPLSYIFHEGETLRYCRRRVRRKC
jgi:CTD nuclear envelope phosphatase 1